MRRRLMSKQGGVKATLIQQLDTQAGDIVFASPNSEEKRFYRLDDGNDVIPSEYVPIGIVVIPASHNVYEDYACGVMSLMLMDGGSPETGSIEGNLLYDYSAYSQQVFDYFCYVGKRGSFTKNVQGVIDVLSGNGVQLPSDLFTKLQNTYDSKTFYDDTSYSYYTPSPYNNDGSRNEAYYQISSPSSSGNALSDFDGIGNTKKLIEGVDNTMFASVSCSKYFTVGTKSGDWYLPAIGEFGYFVSRFKAISSAIQELRKVYGENIASYLICESEMEYWTSTKFTDGLYTFFVDSGSPTAWGDYYEWYSSAIAFTKVGALERNYGDILISGGSTTDIPASGGSSQVTGYTYSQTYGYGDSTTNGGIITGNAEISVTSVSGDNLGTTETERTKKGESVLTVTMNGKTATKSWDVYQEANVKTVSTTGGTYSYGDVTAGSISNGWIGAGGGTGTGYAGNGSQYWFKSATINTETWTSGAIKETTIEDASDGYQTITPSRSSYSISAGSKGTTVSDVTTWSASVYWYGSGGKTASGTIYVQQAANSSWYSHREWFFDSSDFEVEKANVGAYDYIHIDSSSGHNNVKFRDITAYSSGSTSGGTIYSTRAYVTNVVGYNGPDYGMAEGDIIQDGYYKGWTFQWNDNKTGAMRSVTLTVYYYSNSYSDAPSPLPLTLYQNG